MFMKFFIQHGRALLLAAVAVVTAVIFCGTAFAQNKPKAAVYIMGNPEGRDALRMAVNTFLVKSGRYQMIAVDAIDLVAQEQQRQMSGSVSDDQIAKLGQDAGAQYVCVVERTELGGYSYVATRMVSVQSKVAEFADMVKLPQGGDIIEFIKWQVGSMLGLAVGAQPNSAAQTSSASVSNTSSAKQPVNQVTAPTNKPSGIDGSGILTDSRDGKKYKIVTISGITWMAQNLNYQPPTGGSWCYDNAISNCDKYGRLYDWATVMGIDDSYNKKMWEGSDIYHQGICPSGWHVPSRKEWGDLAKFTGGIGTYGETNSRSAKLKATIGWDTSPYTIKGTDDYGFSALPGGDRSSGTYSTSFSGVNFNGYWWTSTATNGGRYVRSMNFQTTNVIEHEYSGKGGYSLRCVMD